MSKKGEGSRGGHIIRHTKSGKAVYGSPADQAHRDAMRKALKSGATGVAIAGAGVGVSASAALGASALDVRSQKLRGFAFSAGKRANRYWDSDRSVAALAATQKSEKLFERSARVGKLGSKVAKFGVVGGAALIALGANKVLDASPLKKHDEVRGSVAAAAGATASFALKNVYTAALVNDVKPLKAIKIAAQTAVKRLIRRY